MAYFMLGGEFMPIESKATILNINQSMSPSSDNAIGFCKPMFEDIFLFSCELAASMDRPPYYGDEIDLGFWEKLNMEFGEPDGTLKIVCMGNSLTEGFGGGGTNWPDVWKDLSGYDVINKGISGETSGQMLARFNADVVSQSPNYCIIECGTNDGMQDVPISQCKANIQAMVNLCLANNIKPRFVHYIQRYNQMQLALDSGKYIFDPNYMAQYLEDVWEYEQSLGYPCLLLNNATDVDKDNADMSYFYNTENDFVHPNALGYEQWGRYVRLGFVDISSSSSGIDNHIYSLHEGWKYKYYYNQKKFIILDENEVIIYEKDNVTTINQFPIDFSVHKSHQFEIIISDASDISTFYIPTGLVKKVYRDSPTVNNGYIPVINNCYLPNYVKSKFPSEKRRNPVVAVVGSSLTSCSLSEFGEGKYPSWCSRFEEVSGYTVLNRGIAASNSGQDLESFWDFVVKVRPDYCIMEVGINDAQDYTKHPKDNTKRVVHSMVNLCKINQIEPIFIIAIPPYNEGDNQPPWSLSYIIYLRDRQNELKEYIESLGYVVYTYFEALEASPGIIDLSLTYDNVHPNSDGNKLLGDYFYSYLSDLEKKHEYVVMKPEDTIKIVMIGDSLTAGYPYTFSKPSKSEDLYSWTHTYRELSGYKIINMGISGDTTDGVLARFYDDVVNIHPDYVFIEIGINDCEFFGYNHLSQSIANIDDMIRICEENSIDVRFITPVARSNMGVYSDIQSVVRYSSALREHIINLGFEPIDYFTPLDSSYDTLNLDYFTDGLHPNERGYEIVGKYIYNQLNSLVGKKENITVVVIGDSITAGYPYTDNKPGEMPNDWASWTATFRELSGYRVINQAIGGTTMVDTEARFMDDVVALHPDYVIVENGNDMRYGLDNFYMTSNAIDSIVRMCEENNINLIFVQPILRYNMTDYVSSYSTEDMIKYCHMMHEYETNLGYPSIVGYYTPLSVSMRDANQTLMYSDTEAIQSFLVDGVHPTLEGYKIVGEWLTPQIIDAMSWLEEDEYPNSSVYKIQQIYEDGFMKYTINQKYDLVKYLSIVGGTQGCVGVDFANKVIPTAQVYEDNFTTSYALKTQVTFKAQMLQCRWILAIMGLTMFPMLEPILRKGEEQNNRPVYEPWLIWGVLKFLGNHEYGGPYYPWDDEDTPNIDVLDGISPNWSY